MTLLDVAAKSNHAEVIPVLLIATRAGDVQINFEQDSTRLALDDGTSVHEPVPIIQKLLELYPALTEVHKDLVSQ